MGLVTDPLGVAGLDEEEEARPRAASRQHWKGWQGWWWTNGDEEAREERLEPVVNS